LFPKISHVHYPALSKIVKQVCAEMNVPYNEFPSFGKAVQSHLKHLKETGAAN
jgi:linoleoyl-CoA desaturase